MGYGHLRAAHPLHFLASGGKVINANKYPGIPKSDKDIWLNSRRFYEFISRFKRVPFLGDKAFDVFDYFQRIKKFYPRRDLSRPNSQLISMYYFITKDHWGEHLIQKLSKKPLPLVTTFFTVAFFAEKYNYPGDIYCIVTDADISRTWVPLNPKGSRINYLAPTNRVVNRLKLYGVRPEQIFFTGFPLPQEVIGDNLSKLKHDLGWRLPNLDPVGKFRANYQTTITKHLGSKNVRKHSNHPLTLMFAVGGAGAQRELGIEIVESLASKIETGDLKINLVAGIHNSVKDYFRSSVEMLGLGKHIGKNINIMYANTKETYFKKFSEALRTTDIIWTKPSEISFYSALGLPIIIAPPIGSQEHYNKRWLISMGAGLPQENPKYANEWLYDWLDSGWFAEAAMEGFLEAPKYGTQNILKILANKAEEAKEQGTVLLY
ncbi:MAG: hypothetical protein COT81_04090 [Candidatus Buchananbacteria bacterium CG10_big_fil_rev_8_21_14_0_10_42_9]|uniref:DUF6938 domain-containing protein n=1 Tax=Candidatus Buchananbacteria bacterium CG10_big_fil_rev_8_21_14_0_10_42_9 TaxID=1974526 RepID=A0A2H0W0I4_9BACT|nr:MAG: hypothetical protein COT81_04090 [Candidatus Buchananbacteria bacterium CG10_big_fil_rev_8_21_14_0_10_42_9]